MKYLQLIFVFVAALAICAHGEPEPEPAKDKRTVFHRLRSAGDVEEARNAESVDDKSETDADDSANANEDVTSNKGSGASTGRLFLRKFLLFKNMFGKEQQQPIIPIIITGGYPNPTSTSPTATITSTGSIPAATGTISTSPTSATNPTATNPTAITPSATTPSAPTPTSPSSAVRGHALKGKKEQALGDVSAAVDEQQLQAALAAGAQEYVVTDQEIRGTSDAKASKVPTLVNLRRPGGKKGQTVTVRIPAQYRKYFKNGQKVMLNTSKRPAKRRRVVQRRRVNRFRRKNVGGKRRRVNN